MFEVSNCTLRCAAIFAGAATLAACHAGNGAATDDAGALAAPTAGEIGVPECDDYVSKARRCIEGRVSADKRPVFEESLDRAGKAWKALAANPGARPGLPQACGLALETARKSMQSYACDW